MDEENNTPMPITVARGAALHQVKGASTSIQWLPQEAKLTILFNYAQSKLACKLTHGEPTTQGLGRDVLRCSLYMTLRKASQNQKRLSYLLTTAIQSESIEQLSRANKLSQ